MVTSRSVTPPQGTFLAQVRNGTIHLPPPLSRYCAAMKWTLFRVMVVNADRLALDPVLVGEDPPASDAPGELRSSLSTDGKLWIPAELRQRISLGEQSVMVRIERDSIAVYLRKVFETLGWGP
jgi:hypothetical protein